MTFRVRIQEKKMGGFKKGASADNPDRLKNAGDSFRRDKSQIKILQMRKSGKPIRDRKGNITHQDFHDRGAAGGQKITKTTGRVQPDRRWFGNTRVVAQTELDRFRDAVAAQAADPYTVILNQKSVPMGLLADAKEHKRSNLLSSESFTDVFGGKGGRRRKRPRLPEGVADEGSLALAASLVTRNNERTPELAEVLEGEDGKPSTFASAGIFDPRGESRLPVFAKGTSRRIWGELYKVLDCSDVIVEVLDARNPIGTRCMNVERHLAENARHKHVVLVLNKCDLVPQWVTRRWVAHLSKEHPTLAFYAATIERPFGKSALIALLRQLANLHSEKKSISVGFVGYPNVGKSSVINALRAKKVCSVAPIPGQTKVWQYVSLMKRVSLIDCPGVVHDSNESETDKVLKGVVRAEKLQSPELFVQAILDRVEPQHISSQYNVKWTGKGTSDDFLGLLCSKSGRLLKGGEPDLAACAVNVINDFQRGRLPFFTPPPPGPAKEEIKVKVSEKVEMDMDPSASHTATIATNEESKIKSSKKLSTSRLSKFAPRMEKSSSNSMSATVEIDSKVTTTESNLGRGIKRKRSALDRADDILREASSMSEKRNL